MGRRTLLIGGLVVGAVTGALALGRGTSAEPAPPQPVRKWEYKSLTGAGVQEIGGPGDFFGHAGMAKLGDEGWELVSVVQVTTGTRYFYFKRPK